MSLFTDIVDKMVFRCAAELLPHKNVYRMPDNIEIDCVEFELQISDSIRKKFLDAKSGERGEVEK